VVLSAASRGASSVNSAGPRASAGILAAAATGGRGEGPGKPRARRSGGSTGPGSEPKATHSSRSRPSPNRTSLRPSGEACTPQPLGTRQTPMIYEASWKSEGRWKMAFDLSGAASRLRLPDGMAHPAKPEGRPGFPPKFPRSCAQLVEKKLHQKALAKESRWRERNSRSDARSSKPKGKEGGPKKRKYLLTDQGSESKIRAPDEGRARLSGSDADEKNETKFLTEAKSECRVRLPRSGSRKRESCLGP